MLFTLWVPVPSSLGQSCSPPALSHCWLFSPQVLVVWDGASSKVRNYRIFEKVSRLPLPPSVPEWDGDPGLGHGWGQDSLPIEGRQWISSDWHLCAPSLPHCLNLPPSLA